MFLERCKNVSGHLYSLGKLARYFAIFVYKIQKCERSDHVGSITIFHLLSILSEPLSQQKATTNSNIRIRIVLNKYTYDTITSMNGPQSED